ncbi:MAG: GNAT family N-acetyltransferase [Cyanobacteria bacterium P01_D01_bin.105]
MMSELSVGEWKPLMIRAVTRDDIEQLLEVTQSIGFEAEETDVLRGMLDEYFQDLEGQSRNSSGHRWVVDDDQGQLVSVAYYAPERMTRGTWNLYLIAVRPEFQGKGRGGALLRYVEADLRKSGDRLLIVETSGVEDFKPAQAFYRKNDFEQEARIRNFYDAGDDKIIFCKALNV